ncbi:MAG TPA: UDP-glucose/GDP-mannose dehydrogenase family protein [Candidatus Polarisedimenticolia bacterium]|nr:UDP-glucose/GDP-mannose dehydrogenase family protein [Candidatus Polarisedimenticolia bacterium]
MNPSMAEGRVVSVIGAGYVGLVTSVGLATLGQTVEVIETQPERLESLRRGVVPIHEPGVQAALDELSGSGRLTFAAAPTRVADVTLICVGTPIDDAGNSDLSQLRAALHELGAGATVQGPIVIRSTMPPGATRRVVAEFGLPRELVLSNPEFLRQGTALADFLHPSRIVLGHFPEATPATISIVADLFRVIEAPLIVVDVTAAELIKNGANAFLALRLSFANELAALCEELGTDVGPVLEAMVRDPRLMSLAVQPGYGFGGSCLPKELMVLTATGAELGLPMQVTRSASDANESHQRRLVERIESAVGPLRGRRIGVLGLAFKAGTDDVRSSPALAVASGLIDAGAHVRAYDPHASSNAARVVPALEIVASAEAAAQDADVLAILTEWPEFKDLDLDRIKAVMAQPLIIDGRRLLDPERVREAGIRYLATGSADEPRMTAT